MSFRRVVFAPVATNAQAFVMLVDVKTNTGKVRVAIEFVAVAQGRTELTIVSIVQNAVQKVVAQIDAQMARALVARATARSRISAAVSNAQPAWTSSTAR